MNAKNKNRYISTKLVLIVSILLYVVTNTFAQYNYSNSILSEYIEKETVEKQNQYTHTLKTLYSNWTRNIENIGSVVISSEVFRKINKTNSTELEKYIEQNAKVLYFEKGLNGLIVIMNGEIAAEWHNEKIIHPTSFHDQQINSPTHEVMCEREHCVNYTFMPLAIAEEKNEKSYVILLVEITDLLMEFYNITNKRIIIGSEQEKLLLLNAIDKKKLQLNNIFPSNERVEIFIEEDVETERSIAQELRNKIVAIAAFSTILLIGIILMILVPPLKRLETLTISLPLLARNKYEKFREKLGKQKSHNLLDIDELHSKSLEISYQLEAFYNNISVNHEIASNIPGALFQFEVLPYKTYSVKYISDGITAISGYKPIELTGSFDNVIKMVHPEDLDEFITSIQRATEKESKWFHEYRIIDKSGNMHWLRGSSIPKKERTGGAIWNGVLQDITPLREAERKANVAAIERKTMEVATKEKEKFFSNISHEIRTPLNTIVGLSHLLNEGQILGGDLKKYHRNINSASQYLLILINNILEQSAIDAGKVEVHSSPVNIKEIANNVAGILMPLAIQKSNKINVFCKGVIPNNLSTDEVKIKQILMNLLSNAIKHTKNGSISINLESLAKTETTVTVRLSVLDTGQGIPENEQAKIFSRFHTIGQQETGTGLGLSITHELVNLLGGTIDVNSTIGIGTEFWVVLTMERAAPKAITGIQAGERTGQGHILLVDDDHFNIFTTEQILKTYGYTVDITQTALSVLEKTKNNSYDLILLDYHMPIKNGLEVIEEIRAAGNNTPVIIYTADLAIMKLKGNQYVDDVLMKPSIPEELNLAIKRLLKKENDKETCAKRDNENVALTELFHSLGPKKMQEMCTIYSTQLVHLNEVIQEAAKKGNQEAIKSAIHRLKSNAGSIGDNKLIATLEKLSNMIKKEEIDSASSFFCQLEKDIKQSIEKLQEDCQKLTEEEIIT